MPAGKRFATAPPLLPHDNHSDRADASTFAANTNN
jgi:hypothetical protein